MYSVRINSEKNVLLFRLEGRLDAKDARQAAIKFFQGVDKLKTGFIVITDLSTFIPVTEEAMTEIGKCMRYAKMKKVAKVIRIVGNEVSKLGFHQFEKYSREIGYSGEKVGSLQEAKKTMDW